jgi:hypothetical protein
MCDSRENMGTEEWACFTYYTLSAQFIDTVKPG